jgi:hypothetical protein
MAGLLPQAAFAAQHQRSEHLYKKTLTDADNPIVFAKLKTAPNEDGCSSLEPTPDGLMTFDIRIFEKLYGASFDVNRIYVDATGSGKEILRIWIDDWDEGGKLPAIGSSQSAKKNWSSGTIRICVGTGVLTHAAFSSQKLSSIFVWYDAPTYGPFLPYPQNRPNGTPMDMRNEADALAVSENGNRVRHLNGGGIATDATEPPDDDHPDFIVDKVWLTTTGGTEQYTYNITDEIKMNGRLKNIGDDDIPGSEHVESRFYLSRGTKEDAHSEWIRVGTDETLGSNLDEGESHSEQEGLNLWEYSEIKPGKTYNIVVCADRTADSGNGDGDWQEEHESNNCSTEAVFTVNGAFNFNVTSVALSTGSANLTPGQAFNITAVAYNAGIDAPVDTRVGYYFSGGSITGDLLVGTSQIKEENFEASTSKNEGLTNVIAPTDAGTYTLKVCTDYDDRVVETNETDNCTTTNFVVAVPSSPSSAPKKTTPGVTGVLFGS